MTCFKHQVYLYGSEAITYLSAIIVCLQSQHDSTDQYDNPMPTWFL